MGRNDVDLFFAEYVAWMRADIGREIAWFRSGHDAGNLLCGLGLVVYTEVLGRVRRWNFDRTHFPRGQRRRALDAQLRRALRSTGEWRIRALAP